MLFGFELLCGSEDGIEWKKTNFHAFDRFGSLASRLVLLPAEAGGTETVDPTQGLCICGQAELRCHLLVDADEPRGRGGEDA